MKLLILYFFLVVSFSCNSTYDEEKLFGSWTIDQDTTSIFSKNGILDKMTFYKNDSFVVAYFMNGKLKESFSGKFKFDVHKKIIVVKTDTLEFQSIVLELTNDRLVTKQVGTKMITEFRRI